MGEALISRRGGGSKIEWKQTPNTNTNKKLVIPDLIGAENAIILTTSSSGNIAYVRIQDGEVYSYSLGVTHYDNTSVNTMTFDATTGTITIASNTSWGFATSSASISVYEYAIY